MRPRHALLVAHGVPSAPAPAEAALARLGASVGGLVDAIEVCTATLANPGALDRAVADLPTTARLLVFPHFMADGWFVSRELRRRLHGAGVQRFDLLPSLGVAPDLPALCLAAATAATRARGWSPTTTRLVLAAHGSPTNPRPGEVAHAVAARVRAASVFGAVTVGFVEQAPFLETALAEPGDAVCLPFFAGSGGHVVRDLPAAAAEARFRGPILPPIGTDPAVAALIATALIRERDDPKLRRTASA